MTDISNILTAVFVCSGILYFVSEVLDFWFERG